VSQNVIELNGKRYDAFTGAYLGKSSVIPKHLMQGRAVDGFMRPTRPSAVKPKPTTSPVPAKQPPATYSAPQHSPKVVDQVTRSPKRPAGTKPLKAHNPERSKTLMRRSVHKPVATIKPAIKPQAPVEIMAKPQSALVRKRGAYSVDPTRLERAKNTVQHHAVRHFNTAHKPTPAHNVAVQVPIIAVKPAPRPLPAQTAIARPVQKPQDVFERALATATSHQQPLHVPAKRRSRKLVNAAAMVATFLVIAGFIGYLNMPALELKVASVQAGFGASMPDYTPTGYALAGGVHRNGGTVSLSFRSGDSQYTITQQASNWNSQTLLDNTLALSDAHRTIEKNGQTIYVYNNGTQAAWVNGGVRYDMQGNASLTSDDIASIATSL
jgi:hypothetical protein